MMKKTGFDYLSCRNLPEMFLFQADRNGTRNFLWRKTEDGFAPTSWKGTADQVRKLAAALRAMGIQPGDRVMLVSENRPEWLMADFAIMSAGAITVPSYTTYTPEDYKYILQDSAAKAVIVSNAGLANKILTAVQSIAGAKIMTIMMDPPPSGLPVYGWNEALEIGAQHPLDIESLLPHIKRDDVACLIYTSGTGGNPKGVMQTHGSLLHNCRGAFDLLLELGLANEVFLSFLPLSHAYEHTAGQMFPVSIGAEIYYVESADKLAGYLTEVRPTIMTAVPRLYETLYAKINSGMRRGGKVQQYLFAKALQLGKKRYVRPGSLNPFEKVADAILDLLVRRKVRAKFGGRLKAMVSGGAPLNYEIGLFFTALGLTILQGYGQTESGPILSCNTPSNNKIETVGPPMTATEIKIAEDGEILARGEMVMTGYWNNPDATAAAVQNGWLHTGDIGHFDAEGRLKITDRKKDIIVLSGGDTLSPQRVEGFLNLEPEIVQSAVFGDKQAYLIALIVPDPQSRATEADIAAAIDRVNKKLSITERVKRFAVLSEGFTMENEMLTPSMKIRRHKIRVAYQDRISTLYH